MEMCEVGEIGVCSSWHCWVGLSRQPVVHLCSHSSWDRRLIPFQGSSECEILLSFPGRVGRGLGLGSEDLVLRACLNYRYLTGPFPFLGLRFLICKVGIR